MRNRNEVEAEIKENLGLVPDFFNSIPDQHLDNEWQLFQSIILSETHIPNKYKELIGVAISAATKCKYCSLFHTETAKLFGATDEEIQEAVHYAKLTTGWSAYINGTQTNYDEFETELGQIGEYIKSKQMAHAE